MVVAILDFRIEPVIILIFLEKATLLYGAVIVTAIFDSKSNGILYGNPFHLIPCIWKHIHRVKYHGSMLNTNKVMTILLFGATILAAIFDLIG